jgi:hypothetical protein
MSSSSSDTSTSNTQETKFSSTLKSIVTTINKNTSLSITVSYYVLYILMPGILFGLILLYVLYSPSIIAKDIRSFFTFNKEKYVFDGKPPGGNFI